MHPSTVTRLSAAPLALLASCAVASQTPQRWPVVREPPRAFMQGYAGASINEIKNIDLDPSLGDFDSSEDETLPLLGGVYQGALWGEHVQLGFEGGGSLEWRGDITSFVSNGGLTVTADISLFVVELYAGVYTGAFLGDHVRVYAGAGPLVQFASIDGDWDDPGTGTVEVSGDGVGWGFYGRAGLEYELSQDTWIGVGARATHSDVSLSDDLGEMELDALQFFATFTLSW